MHPLVKCLLFINAIYLGLNIFLQTDEGFSRVSPRIRSLGRNYTSIIINAILISFVFSFSILLVQKLIHSYNASLKKEATLKPKIEDIAIIRVCSGINLQINVHKLWQKKYESTPLSEESIGFSAV